MCAKWCFFSSIYYDCWIEMLQTPDYLRWWLVLILNVTNSWVELIFENQLAKEGCPGAYKHVIKLTLNSCGTLGL